uniref:Uncharacterized protein n=1 Tax=Cacopsylla melanoneura TaxID=428564 RepID=A0A8D8RHV0_9HEMI
MWHINHKELYAIRWAIESNQHLFRNRSITVLTDNTAVAQGNGQTSTSSSLPSVGLKTYPSTRNVQHSSRQALSKPEPPGVASYSGGNYSNLQEVGNSRGGPICLSPISRSAELRDSRSARSTSPVHGRVLKTLEIQPRLGLHSACTHPNGSTTPRDSNGYNYPSDSSMGPHVLPHLPR